MYLTPREQEKLLIIVAADLARSVAATRLEAELPRGRGADRQRADGRRARRPHAWPT